MGKLTSVDFDLPGSLGLNTQDERASQEQLKYATEVINGTIDTTGKLVSRKDFVLQTSAYTGTIETLYTNRNQDATEVIYSAGSGKINSGISTLTQRFTSVSGFQKVDVGGAKAGATATGLSNSATVYTASVVVDGTTNAVSVTGSTAQTYTNLLTQLNADITGATFALSGGNLVCTSASTGASSTISMTAGTVFTTLTNYVAVRTANAGNAGGSGHNNWQFATLSGKTFAAQTGKPFRCWDETFANVGFIGQPWTAEPNCVIAAYGRIWCADDQTTGNRYTVWWSKLLTGHDFGAGGDAGNIDLTNAWPGGQDSIVAIVGAFGRIIILGRNSILLYTLPSDNDPASMTLTDTVSNTGCVARDSVVVTDDGIYFLSDNGIYRINRLAQVTSLITLPLMSRLCNDDVLAAIAAETPALIRGGYYPAEGVYTLSFPTSNKTYALHTRRLIPELNVPAFTTWTNVGMPFRGFCYDKGGLWYCAGTNGVYKYTGYTPDGSNSVYSFDYYSPWINFGDEGKLKHNKVADMVLSAASGQAGTFRWQADYLTGTTRSETFSCDATEFAENPGVGTVRIQTGGTGRTFRYGFRFTINGSQVKAYTIRPFVNQGATRY